MANIDLSLPKPRTSVWAVETDPRYARAWFETLPLADSAAMARELFQALYTLNRLALSADKRIELMGMYEGHVAAAIKGLLGGLAHLSYPLSKRKWQAAELARQLLSEMANGYKIILIDLANQRFSWRHRSSRPQFVHRAIYYLGQVLLRSYHLYTPFPPLVWRDMNRLYAYAESQGWTGEGARKADTNDVSLCATIGQEYFRALLLAASQPYQLPQDDCLLVYRLLERRAALATFGEPKGVAAGAGCFVVDMDSDGPPFVSTEEASPRKPNVRCLNLVELVQAMSGIEHRLRQGASVASLDLGFECLEVNAHEMFRRLIRSWTVSARRQHQRIKRKEYISVCVGLYALNFFSSGSYASRTPTADSLSEDLVIPGVKASDSRPDSYRVDRWQVVDVSARGMQLLRPASAVVAARVGDLVGLQRTEGPGIWLIAVVRWLKNLEGGQLDLGIELLGPQARAVEMCFRPSDQGAAASSVPAILLPPMEVLHRPATFVVPRGQFRQGGDFEISELGHPGRRVRALKLLERSSSFEQVVYADLIGE